MSEMTFEEQQEYLRKTRERRLEDAVLPRLADKIREDEKRDLIHSAVVNANRANRNDFSEKPDAPSGFDPNWRNLHWKVKVKMAEDLMGVELIKTDEMSTADQAEQILERIEKGAA